MNATMERIPAHLRKYCVDQRPSKYSARDHAAWRFIMRQSRAYFKDHAVPVYLEGLQRTGITSDRIPSIEAMDAKLKDLGWGAVPVEGFIPPAAFLDFQARRILPIASDMRSPEHIHYTPAPDIVHEAAGHAPILVDPAYSDYLQKYASMAQKAIFSREDLDLYEAIRTLSDVKENPDSTAELIKAADAALQRASAAVKALSEANKVARMNWWTVEYGLIGTLAQPKIYGAGLLSSVGESQACLSAHVKKLRLTLACVDTGYDITEPQPQLFVAEDIEHMTAVLQEFDATLAYRRGGVYGLEQARAGRTVTTTVLDSGLQISGVLAGFELRGSGAVGLIRWQGPVQLSAQGRELAGQGREQHASGFSSPLGRAALLPEKPLRLASPADLERLGLKVGSRAILELTSGFQVSGLLAGVTRAAGDLLSLKWQDCTVRSEGKVYFEPSWGDFDMAVGEAIVSVFGGPADPLAFGEHEVGTATTAPGRTSPYTAAEESTFAAYQQLRELREQVTPEAAAVDRLAARLAADFPEEWLLRLEVIELMHRVHPDASAALAAALAHDSGKLNKDIQWLVRQGLALAALQD